MKSLIELRAAAGATRDPATLYSLLEEALELAEFEAGRAEFALLREAKLRDQIQRQAAAVDNLQKTPWKV